MGRVIKIPMLGIETNVSSEANENEIIQAVAEASVAFCIASTEHGDGIKNELKKVEDDER